MLSSKPFMTFSTPLGKDLFIPHRFFGYERMNEGFRYRIHCEVDKGLVRSLHNKMAGLIGQSARLTLHVTGHGPQYFEGLICDIRERYENGGRSYRFELTSKFQLLRLSQPKGTYLEQSALEIIQQVFERFRIAHQFKSLKDDYPSLDFMVQYDENSYDFIRRILSEWGLYFYTYCNAKQPHTLIISDNPHAYQRVKGNSDLRIRAEGGDLSRRSQTWSGVPHSPLDASPGYVMDVDCGTDPGEFYYQLNQGPPHDKRATPRVDYPEDHWDRWGIIHWGQIHEHHYLWRCYGIDPAFRLATVWPIQYYHDEPVEKVLITEVRHRAGVSSNGDTYYHNKLLGRSGEQRIYPPEIERPYARGPLPAIVTSEGSDEVWRGHYGKVRVHYPWDENHPPDETSTPWLRVIQPLAGVDYGTVFTPRKGSEVMVTFIHDDHARPIVQCAMHPKEQSTWQTHTVAGEQGNQLLFNDEAGQEEIRLEASKDFQMVIKGDFKETVQGNQTLVIGHNAYQLIKEGDDTLHIQKGDYELLCQNGNVIIEAKQGFTFQTPGGKLSIMPDGITIEGKTVKFISGDEDNLDFAARAGDRHQCPEREGEQPHRGGALQGGSEDVFINGEPAVRLGDESSCEVGEPNRITSGAKGVFINNMPAARSGDMSAHGGNIVASSGNVVIGGENSSATLPSGLRKSDSCQLIKLSIGCSHKERNYEADLINQLPFKALPRELEVLHCSDSPEIIQLTATVSCSSGGDCLSVYLHNQLIGQGNGVFHIPLLATKENQSIGKNISSFLTHVLLLNDLSEESIHRLAIQTCHKTETFLIYNYIPMSWSGSIVLDFKERDLNFWHASGELQVKSGNRAWLVKNSISSPAFKKAQELIEKVIQPLIKLKDDNNKLSDMVKVDWPTISLSGNMTRSEAANNHKVIKHGEINLSCAPLIGLNIKIDLLDVLIARAPGFSEWIESLYEKIVKWAKKNNKDVSAKLSISLQAKSSIGGSISWRKGASIDSQWSTEGKVTGEISLEVQGEARVEGRVWLVYIAAGASIGAKATIGAEIIPYRSENLKATDPKSRVNYYFNGLTLYWAMYLEVNIKKEGEMIDKNTEPANNAKDNMSLQTAMKGNHTIIPSFDSTSTNDSASTNNIFC